MTDYIAYYRVSTSAQGRSGLGLEAQQEAAKRFVGENDQIISTFVEVESGRNCSRPQLAAALAECRRRRATLLIAKLDRLSRNVRFIAELLESDVQITAVDMPNADRFTLHIMSAVAEQEARAISARTKAALAAARARGTRLGGSYRFTDAQRARGAAAGNAVRAGAAKARAVGIMPVIEEARQAGAQTLQELADRLNAAGIPTAKGAAWRPVQVARAIRAAA